MKELISDHSAEDWDIIAEELSARSEIPRSDRQCKERWRNHLDPSLKCHGWLPEEQDKIFKLARLYENRWSKIAKYLPGRSENSIKNYYFSTIRKNIRKVNKKLILRDKITGSTKELSKNPELTKLIFCSSENSKLMAERIRRNSSLGNNTINSESGKEIEDKSDIMQMINHEIISNQVICTNLWIEFWKNCSAFPYSMIPK